MKNKTKTYILIVAVLGIWGTVGYKILNGLSPNQPSIAEPNVDLAFNPKQPQKVDTFSIQTINRDPFLGTITAKKKTTSIKPTTRTTKVNNEKPELNIVYGGLVKKQDSKEQVFVVNINNQQYLLKLGQSIKEVKLLRGDEQKIVVRYNGKNQTINL